MSQASVRDEIPEVIEEPLTPEALGAMYRRMCDDPCLANIPGKIELDMWGRMVMSPASNYHSMVQMRLGQRLLPLGGQAFSEASVVTAAGLFVADVAWASEEFLSIHGTETPFTRAPELCIEVTSPSNSRRELNKKVSAYLTAGAVEAWIVYIRAKRIEFHGGNGPIEHTAFAIDLDGLFD
jgi:Uma2 family endonuclease